MDYKSTRLIERFILSAVSSSFVIIVLNILNSVLLKNQILDFVFVNFFTYASIIVFSFIYSGGMDFFVTTKSRTLPHIVILISCIILMLILSFMFQQYDAPYALIPAMIVLYIISAQLNSIFLYHDVFLESIAGMKGEELRTYLFHNNLTAGDFGRSLKKLQTLLFGLGFIVFVSLLGGKIAGVRLSLFIILITIIFYLGILISFMLIGLYNREIYYAFLGFDNILERRYKIFKFAAIIVLASSLTGLALSSNSALIKIKPLEEKEREEIKIENPEYHESFEYFDFDMGPGFLDDLPESKIDLSLLWYILDKVGKVLIVIGALLVLIYGIYRIIISGTIQAFFREKMLSKFINQLLSDIKEFFRMIFNFKFEKEASYATVQSKSFKNAIGEFLKKSRKSREKRLEIDRLTKQFMTLIDWGSRRSLDYRVTMAPAEYTKLIKEYFDFHDRKSHSAFASSAGYLFEKALYDKSILSEMEEKEFLSSIKSITSYTIQ